MLEYFGITGGEPFIRKDLIDIISYSKMQGEYDVVFFRGVLIDQAMAERIVASGLDVLQFSLDGPKKIFTIRSPSIIGDTKVDT